MAREVKKKAQPKVRHHKSKGRIVVYVCLALFFLFTVIVPIATMLGRITPESFSETVRSAQFLPALKNSLTTALTATVISLSLAIAAAWCMERIEMKFKGLLAVVFIIPMLIPSISHAFGLIALFGANGIVTNLLGFEGGIYGFVGIVVGSVMYSFPVAFLMFSSILKYEDGTPYRACDVLGIPLLHRFLGITIPYLKKPLISAFFAVFTMIVTDYGVPLLIGGRTMTLSVLMYNKAVSMLDYQTGSVIGAVLLVPAIIAFLIDFFNPETSQATFVADRVRLTKTLGPKCAAYIYSFALAFFVLAPIVAFSFMVFETKYPIDPTPTLYHIQKTIGRGAGGFLANSLVYASITALLGTFVAFICAYMSARMKGALGRATHLISMATMAIPGLVLGLAYVIFFHDQAIYGTIFIVVLVNSIHFFASPYLMMHNALEKVNQNLEVVGQSLGIHRVRIIVDVIVPKVKYTIYEMLTYFFVNSMMTISAVAFLAPPAPKPIALMINQFEAQLLMESAAFVTLLIFLVNIVMKIIMRFINKRHKDEVA